MNSAQISICVHLMASASSDGRITDSAQGTRSDAAGGNQMRGSCLQPVRRPARRRAFRRASGILAVLAALILLSACGSGGQGGSGGQDGSGGALAQTANQPEILSATPADVPSAAPQCPGSASAAVSVPANLDGLISACASPSGDEVVVTNLSELVFDVHAASSTSPQLTVRQYDPSPELLPAEDRLEIEEQNAAVADWQPSAGEVFLPVGAQVVATSDQPVVLAVQWDPEVSATSLFAELLTAHVVDSLPENSVLSYYSSLAACINDAYKLWDEFTQQNPPSTPYLMQQALQTVASCQQLQHKLSADAEAEHAASDDLQPDLATEAGHAGADWQSESEDAPHFELDIR